MNASNVFLLGFEQRQGEMMIFLVEPSIIMLSFFACIVAIVAIVAIVELSEEQKQVLIEALKTLRQIIW